MHESPRSSRNPVGEMSILGECDLAQRDGPWSASLDAFLALKARGSRLLVTMLGVCCNPSQKENGRNLLAREDQAAQNQNAQSLMPLRGAISRLYQANN